MSETMALEEIRVGERHRIDLGDIQGLASSIEELGLMHPVVVTPDGELIAGQRRLEACRSLGWVKVPVTVVPIDDLLKGEWAENAMRKDLTPSEAVAIGRLLEESERGKAAARRRATQFGNGAFNLSEPSEKGRADAAVAKAVGMSATSYRTAKAVIEAAEADPDLAPIVEEMDRTGNVHGAYRQVKAAEAQEPPVPFKSRAATAERRERMQAMAQEGYRSDAIAQAVGMNEETVRRQLRDAGIEIVEERIHVGKRIDPNQVMETLVADAVPLPTVLNVLRADWSSLDKTRFPDWIAGLESAVSAYRRLIKSLKE